MANIDKSTFLNEPAVARPQAGVHERATSFRFAAGEDTATNRIRLFRLPKGAKLLPFGWYIEAEDPDTNATPTLDMDLIVSDGTTTYVIINGGSTFQAAAVAHDQSATIGGLTGWVNAVTSNPNFYVAILVNTAAATLSTTADIIVTCKYSCDLESGGV